MKKLLLILLILLITAAAGAAFYISSIDWNEHKSVIAKQFSEATGKQINFAGPISFKILPSPYLSATNVKILNPAGEDKSKPLVEIKDLVATLSLSHLIKGQFEIQHMELRNPQINLELLPSGRLNWESDLDPEQRRAIEESHFALNSVSIGGATLNLVDTTHNIDIKLENLNGEIIAQSIMGPYRIEGNYTKDNVPEGFAVSLGQLSDSFTTTLNLVITHPTSESYIRFDGNFNLANQVINGNVIVESKKLHDFWTANIKSLNLPDFYDYPLAITSDINFTPQQLTLSNIVVKYGNTQGAGNLQLPFNDGFGNGGVTPRIDMAFNLTDLDLTPFAQALNNFIADHATEKSEYSPELDFDILADIKAVRTTYKNQQLKNFELSFDIVENILTLNNLSATLPGDTDFSVKGSVSAFENEPFYNLDTTLNSNDFLKTLNWLEIAPNVSTAATYRKAVGNAKFSGTLRRIQVSPFKFTLDKSSVSGEAGIKRGARDDIMLIINADMINFDNYISSIPNEEREKNWAQRMAYRFSKLGFLNDFDMQITARMDVGIYEKMPFEKVNFQASLLDGKMDINNLQIGSVASSKIELFGQLNGFGKTPIFKGLNFNIQTDNVAALINKLEFKAPNLDYKKLHDFQIIGAANGNINTFATTSKIRFENLEASYSGMVNRSGEQIKYNGDLELKHPDFAKMLNNLNFEYTPQASSTGLINLKTTIDGTVENFQAKPLVVNIGFNTFSGSLNRKTDSNGRTAIQTELDINKFEIERFLNKNTSAAAPAITGLKSDTSVEFLPKPLWSKDKADYSFYRSFDIDGKFNIQELNYRQNSFSNTQTELSLNNGNLDIKAFSSDYLGGKLNADARLQMNDRPIVSGKISLKGADTDSLNAGGSVYALKNGTFDFTSDFESVADSEFDFVSGLNGKAEFDFSNLNLKGWNLPNIYQDITKREDPDGLSALVKENLLSGSTSFEHFKGSAQISAGKITLNNAVMNNADSTITLSGDGSLPDWSMNILFSAKYQEPQYLPGFAFSLKGQADSPLLDIDVSALYNLYKSRQNKKEADVKAAETALKNHLTSLIDNQKNAAKALSSDISAVMSEALDKQQHAFSNEAGVSYADIRKQLDTLSSDLTQNINKSETAEANDELINALTTANTQATAKLEELRGKIKSAYLTDQKKSIQSTYNQIVESHNQAKQLSFQYNGAKDGFASRLAAIITDFKPAADINISGWHSFIEDKLENFDNQDKQLLDDFNKIQKSDNIEEVEQYKEQIQSLRDAAATDLRELENSISEYRDYTEKKVAAQEEAYAAKLRNKEVQRKLEENTGSISIKKSGRTVTVRRNIEDIEKAEELTEEQEVKVLDFSKPKAKIETPSSSSNINVVKKGRTRR